MGTGRKYNKKPVTRPKKKTRERARRVRDQQKRLVAAGHSEEAVSKMTTKDIREHLREAQKAEA